MTTSFPKIGDEPLTSHLVNVSGDRSRYTMPVPRKGPSGDQMDGPTGHRGATSMSGEHNGPRFRPVTTLYAQNAAAASDTGRGMRTLPSAMRSPFWDKRNTASGAVI